jgi:excinuclease ABC subunit B
VGEIHERIEKDQRVFVTTLTKKMAEDLTDYFKELGHNWADFYFWI